MSIISTLKGLVAKVNDHTQVIKEYDDDLDGIVERLEVLEEICEVGVEVEEEASEEEEAEEEVLKLED